MLTLTIPYPPTVNTYWRRHGHTIYVSKAGMTFRSQVAAMASGFALQPLEGRLAVEIALYPPDRRKRDVDNVAKATLDALSHAGLIGDDSQIDTLLIKRMSIEKGGKAVVCITENTEPG